MKMSTRSGKRLHGSFQEVSTKFEDVVLSKSEKKTRNKRSKENEDHSVVTLPKSKKKKNYVSYPSNDDDEDEPVDKDVKDKADDVTDGVPRKLRRHTLKEQNVNTAESEMDSKNNNKTARVTRQKRKFVETEDLQAQDTAQEVLEDNQIEKVKLKKNKKKKSKSDDVNDAIDDAVENEVKESKKSKKKKKGKRLKNAEVKAINVLNGSNMSTDSFHSAAGSPMQESSLNVTADKKGKKKLSEVTEELITTDKKSMQKNYKPNRKQRSSIKNGTLHKDSDEIISNNHVEETKLDSCSKKTKKKSKSSSINGTFEVDTVTDEKVHEVINNTIEKSGRRSSIKNATFDKEAEDLTDKDGVVLLSVTTENITSNRKSSIKNATFDKDDVDVKENDQNSTYDKVEELSNDTFDKEPTRKKSLRSSCTIEEINNSVTINTTFEKTDGIKPTTSLDTTFDKSDIKNSTFDKGEPKISSDKSSIISSDASNLTYDKDNSRISITSDDSRAENIVNTTPVLIESSMEESLLSSSKKSLEEDKKSSPPSQSLSVPTPLKREGTFTKEIPEVVPIKEKTPTKRMSLPSPGCTPFHTSRSSQKSVLNVTRSIEKPGRKSLLVELMPRQTKVMFCSPVNNPAVVTLQKKKVIKSSLKGSNKSFVFDDCALSSRPAARKRSYTQGDADDVGAKRKRLADDLQNSVNRLSRPRTSSAAAKLTEPTTPSKKPVTPLKAKSDTKRTKLPNFAALHQKQFDRMESLDECQERKAKRARQLLTPNGAIAVLERSSPKGPTEPVKPKEVPKKAETPSKPKKPETPSKPKLPTLESLRPGFTRFGFKMNTEFNPFTIPSKSEKKEKENKKSNLPPKSVLPTIKSNTLTRQQILPSINGATRKEVAKQTIMREKSSTSLSNKRDVKRKESRTIIKGVRTNRRFELQMQMRSID